MHVAHHSSVVHRDPVDLGLLILRVGIGSIMLILHGWGKISGGPELWGKLGGAMSNLGIEFVPVFWGFMAAFSEFACSGLVVLGILFRPAAFLLVGTMFVAALRHLLLPADQPASGFSGAAHALEFLIVYLALFVAGPGKYRLSRLWRRQRSFSSLEPGAGV